MVIPAGWRETTIGAFSKIVSGGTPSTKIDLYWGGDVPWCTPTDITACKSNYLSQTSRNITKEGLSNSAAIMLPKDALLLCTRATVGEVRIAAMPMATNQGFKSLIVDGENDNKFVFYMLKTLKPAMLQKSSGSTFLELGKTDLANIRVTMPELNEQKVIAEALSDADLAIESHDALITKKRAIRDSVLYELIVNHGGETEISFSKDVSLKARIGWQGLTTAEYQVTGDCLLVTGTDLNGGAVDWGTCWQVAQSRYDQDPQIQLRNGDVLVTKDGTIGKVGFVADLPGKATLNSGVFVIRPTSNELLPEYLRYVMFSPLFDRFLNRLTAGSTILHLYQKDFVNFSFCVPDLEQQAHASTILKDLDEELAALSAKKEKLEMIKQGMMQDLLTGKVRLS